MPNEIDYAAVFGLTEEDLSPEVGAQEQEVAAPAEETQSDPVEGAKEQEVADPATGDEEPAGEVHTDPDKPAQSKEERSRNAAARRQAEQDALVARIRAEEQAKAQAAIEQAQMGANYGRLNPYTGKPMQTKADLDEYQAAYQAEAHSDTLKDSGVDMNALNAVIERHPLVQKARLALEKIEQQEQDARMREGKARLDADIAAVSKLDARVKTVADIGKLEKAGEIVARVRRGYSFEDAYRLEYADRLQGAVAGAAKQAAVQAVKGKAHMQPHESRGGGGVEIPRDELEMYRAFNPGVSDEEFYKHAARVAAK